MLYETQLETIKQAKLDLNHMVSEIKTQLSNKHYSLEERWQLFETLSNLNLLDTAPYLPSDAFDQLEADVVLYDTFYIERYETRSYIGIYKQIVEEHDFPQENIDAWREAVLKEGYQSFTYDW